MHGGPSQVDLFDYKPRLQAEDGGQLPFKPAPNISAQPKLLKSPWKFARHGQSGQWVSELLPSLATCVDDICFVRNLWTTDNDHAAENQIHTGRHRLDETQPSIGSWVHYGLGTLNQNLPKFVVLGGPTRSDTRQSIDAYYLGPQHAGVPLATDPAHLSRNDNRDTILN